MTLTTECKDFLAYITKTALHIDLHLLIYVCSQSHHLFFGCPFIFYSTSQRIFVKWLSFHLLSVPLTWSIQFNLFSMTNKMYLNLQRAVLIFYYLAFSIFIYFNYPKKLLLSAVPSVNVQIFLHILPSVLLLPYKFLSFLLWVLTKTLLEKTVYDMLYLHTYFFNLWS